MKRIKKPILLVTLLLLMGNLCLLAQEKRTISGVVRDDQGNAVPGASVTVKGTLQTAVTDEKGRYTLSVTGANPTLLVSSVGFTTKELKAGDSNTLDIEMSSSAADMEEVVVTALGVKRDKKSVGFAVQQVKAEDVTIAAPVDVAQGLMGKVAGLNISNSNGLNNSSSRIVIRGNNSITGNNQPLIVIDGAILENKPLAQSNIEVTDGMRDWGNYMSYVNMDNVESISVLKGPNAAALYGARGANGVILITTKKGSVKKGIGLDYSFTNNFTNVYRFQEMQNQYGGGFAAALWTLNPELPKTENGEYYLPTLYPSAWNGNPYAVNGTGINASHEVIPGGLNTWDVFSWFGASASWGPKLAGQQVRWWDGEMRSYTPQPDNRKFYYKQGTDKTHNVSFSGGGDFGTVRLSVSRTDADAVVPNTHNNNTSFSLGSNLKISKAITAEVSVGYNQAYRLNTPEIGTNNSWTKFSIYGMSREYQPLEYKYYKNADGSKYNFPGSYPHAEYGNNLWWNFYENNSRLQRDELLSTVKLNAEITPWLNAFVRTSANFIGTNFTAQNNTTSVDHMQGGSFSRTVSKDKTYNTDFMITAHKNDLFVKGLNASLSGMYNNYSTSSRGVSASNNSVFAVPDVYALSNYTNINNTSFSESRFDIKSNSLLGLLNLSYKDYLFLDVTGRNDITSTLPKNNNSYFYPSASLAFVFTEALNMNHGPLSYGKLRVAYGRSANATDPYQLDFQYSVGTFGGQTTNALPTTVPPYELRFQTSRSYEVGTSLGFFQNRVNLDFTYYDISSTQQIMTANLPVSSGASAIRFNTGELSNKGIEFIINATAVNKRNFSWNITVNGASNRNKVVALYEGVQELRIADVFGNLGVFMKVAPGDQYGTLYGTDFVRDDKGNKLIENIKDGSGNVLGTRYRVTVDPVAIGNATPKLTGGIGNTFRYKAFSVYALVDAKIGGDIYSFDHSTAMGGGLSPATLVERNGGGLPYTFPDGTTGNVGVIMDGYNVDDGKMNDRVVNYMYKYAGSYTGWTHLNRPRSLSVFENTWVKFREFAVSYNVPKNFLGRTKVFQNLSVSLIGRNLFYIYSSLPDKLNPEGINGVGNGQGLQWSAFPSMRTIGFSIKTQF
ncbi:MAG: SusC/RagA family TonB-linked outer membrane protein [Agriterribacter sp.]